MAGKSYSESKQSEQMRDHSLKIRMKENEEFDILTMLFFVIKVTRLIWYAIEEMTNS